MNIGGYLQTELEDPNIMEWLFDEIEAVDPDTSLFIQDHDVWRSPDYTSWFTEQARRLRAAGHDPFMGVKGSFTENFDLDPIGLAARLDIMSTSGSPIWITSLYREHPDVIR